MDSVNVGVSKSKNDAIGLVVILIKIGTKLIPILTKFIKVIPKILKTLLSFKGIGAMGSLGLYSFLFSWQMGVSLVAFLFIHEYGHLWAMKKCGIKTKGIYLIPGLGAAAIATERWKSGRDEAYIALMGPAVGLLFIGPMVVLYLATKNPMFIAIASIMSVVNLFNLFPINPLDGGRIVKSLLYSFRGSFGFFFSFLSLVAAAIVAHYTGMGLLVFVAIIGIWETIVDYGLTGHFSALIKTFLRVLVILISCWFLPMLMAIGTWWLTMIACVAYFFMALNVIIDARGSTKIENLSVFDYPVVIIKDIWRGLASIFKIRPEHLKRVEQYEKMSKNAVILYSSLYVVTIIVMVALIMYADSVPGCQVAKKILM